MFPRPIRIGGWLLALLVAVLTTEIGPNLPGASAAPDAVPLAQAQPSPSPRPTSTARPTVSAEQRAAELGLEKLREEAGLAEEQRRRLAQERYLASLPWWAPATFIQMVGPTLLGLLLLMLAWRALARVLPPPPPRPPRPSDEDDEDEDDL